MAETYIVLLRELGHKAAFEFLERIKASPRVLKIFSNENMEAEAEEILVKYIDQEFSYVDAASFVIMKRQRIRKAFCFDKHFVTAGFMNVPETPSDPQKIILIVKRSKPEKSLAHRQ